MDKTLMLHLLERAVPFLRDEGDKYDDDGSNEPLELARDIESVLASNPPNESAVVPAKTAFDGGAEAADALRATTGEGECSEHVRKQIGRLAQWQLCMSHNESYFGEPAGLVKSVVEELIHAVDPIYPPITPPADPLSGVTISYTTTQARGCPDKDTSWIDRCDDNPPGSLNSPAPDLGKAVDMLLASAPAHMTHRNAAEREAYRLLREARATPTPPPEPTTKARIQRGELAGLAPERDAGAVDELDRYDAGLLNDYGGGNVGWWQDYIRAELDRAHDFYQSQIAHPAPAQPDEAAVERACIAYWNDEVEGRPHPNPWPKGAEPFVEDIRKGMRAALTAAAQEKE